MKVSVIIVSYNSSKVLFECLDSIEAYNDLGNELEVIVVDNYEETDLSNESFINYTYTIRYIKNEKNSGFGAGNNLGIRHAQSEVVFFLNPDTILVEPIFSDLYNAIVNNDKLVYGFSLVDRDLNRNDSFSFMYDNMILYHLLAFLKKHPIKRILRAPFVNKRLWPWGAAFALSKHAFVAAGMFDENIFLCNEEGDLMHRIKDRKVEISNHRIIHLEGHGVTESTRRNYEFLKSRQYYFDKYKITYFNQKLWDIFTYLLAFRDSLCKKDPSRQNFYKAYKEFVSENNKK